MLQYLIILLDDTSTSYCYYKNTRTNRRLMPVKMLKQGIRFGMKENLMIQYVYPNYELPNEYSEVIESIDHSKIKPTKEDTDIWVTESIKDIKADLPVVWRTDKQNLFSSSEVDIINALKNVPRLNIVLTDADTFNDANFEKYESFLNVLSEHVVKLYMEGNTPQINLLTDRMVLSNMNNCGAGDTTITLAPNGKFYVCPAFYVENDKDYIGDLENGLDIKTKQLYKLDHAPICQHCDAWQCKRCIWLNRKTTLEVNTPSHEQCVISHLERNASRELLQRINLPNKEDIKEIDYLDPFDKRNEWQ